MRVGTLVGSGVVGAGVGNGVGFAVGVDVGNSVGVAVGKDVGASICSSCAPLSSFPLCLSSLAQHRVTSNNLFPKIGFRPCEYFQAKNIGTIAPPITNARVGSQSPNTSSHPCTFEVSVIPENNSPIPKRDPEIKAVKALIRLYPKHDETLKL